MYDIDIDNSKQSVILHPMNKDNIIQYAIKDIEPFSAGYVNKMGDRYIYNLNEAVLYDTREDAYNEIVKTMHEEHEYVVEVEVFNEMVLTTKYKELP